MKITPDWILQHDACSDGAEWGIKTVGEGIEAGFGFMAGLK